MKQQDVNWPAVRALARVWRPIGEQLAMAEAADAGFDGGEFSGPMHARYEEKVYHETAADVAARFNLQGPTLEEMVQFAEYYEYGHLLAAVGKTQAMRKMPKEENPPRPVEGWGEYPT